MWPFSPLEASNCTAESLKGTDGGMLIITESCYLFFVVVSYECILCKLFPFFHIIYALRNFFSFSTFCGLAWLCVKFCNNIKQWLKISSIFSMDITSARSTSAEEPECLVCRFLWASQTWAVLRFMADYSHPVENCCIAGICCSIFIAVFPWVYVLACFSLSRGSLRFGKIFGKRTSAN